VDPPALTEFERFAGSVTFSTSTALLTSELLTFSEQIECRTETGDMYHDVVFENDEHPAALNCIISSVFGSDSLIRSINILGSLSELPSQLFGAKSLFRGSEAVVVRAFSQIVSIPGFGHIVSRGDAHDLDRVLVFSGSETVKESNLFSPLNVLDDILLW
jgi:hypothetical protein